MKSVLSKYFNVGRSQSSPIIPEYQRVSNIDEKGIEYVSYVPFDLTTVTRGNGSVNDWKLNNLIRAGINPAQFNIHTGNVSRIEGIGDLTSIMGDLDAFLNENKNNKE